MSGTQVFPPVGTAAENAAIAAAGSLAALQANLTAAGSPLAGSITPKPLVQSRTIWVTLATLILSWACARYGLALDPDAQAGAVGAAVMVATAVMRAITRAPIAGVLTVPPVPPKA
jgi:hypothetical protein